MDFHSSSLAGICVDLQDPAQVVLESTAPAVVKLAHVKEDTGVNEGMAVPELEVQNGCHHATEHVGGQAFAKAALRTFTSALVRAEVFTFHALYPPALTHLSDAFYQSAIGHGEVVILVHVEIPAQTADFPHEAAGHGH